VPPDREAIHHAVVVLKQRGKGQRTIATELGISRKQVRSVLKRVARQRDDGHSALPPLPRARASQLDAFKSRIQDTLDCHPDITARRLLDELRSWGYKGGYTIVKERLRELRPRPKVSPVERFETAPGKQGQQDWSPYVIPFTRDGKRKLKCFSLVLAFSRRQYVRFCSKEDQLTLERQHIAAFERFGGVPEEILYDGQKAVVLRREAGRPIYNPKFLAFATHYGFRPHALPPRRPELKGKVEQPFKYVEGNLLNARTLETKADLDSLTLWWMDNTSDLHVHDTTKERPIDRFAREREHLLPLPRHPFDTAEVGYRVVSDDAWVRWDDVRYSVPYANVLDVVVLRVTEHEVFVYSSDLSRIAAHARAPRGHLDPVIDPAHRPLRKPRHDIEALCARLAALGESGALFGVGVCRAQRYRGTHLSDTLALIERYDAEDLLRAMARAVRYRAFDAGVVSRILATTATTRTLPSTEDKRVLDRMREQGALLPGATRGVEAYAAALAGDDADVEDGAVFDIEEAEETDGEGAQETE
jgi:transposase